MVDCICHSSTTAKVVIASTISKVGRPDKNYGFYAYPKEVKKDHMYGLNK